MGKEKIQKIINIFVNRVRQKYKPEKIILFGSYAKGKANKTSDIDILVVSPVFSNIKPFERSLLLHKLTTDLDPDVNAVGCTPYELINSSSTVIKDALLYGIKIN